MWRVDKSFEAVQCGMKFSCVIFMRSGAHEIDQYRNYYIDACSPSAVIQVYLVAPIPLQFFFFLKNTKINRKNSRDFYYYILQMESILFRMRHDQLITWIRINFLRNFNLTLVCSSPSIFLSSLVYWRTACDRNKLFWLRFAIKPNNFHDERLTESIVGKTVYK